VLTVGFVAPARAQSNQPITSGTFYEDRATFSVGGNVLNLTFAQTPANQFLNVTNVSCSVWTSSQAVISRITLRAGTSIAADDLNREYSIKGNPTPEIDPSDNNKYYSIVTNQVFFKFGPGRYPSIQFLASAGGSGINAQCVIVGNLTAN
jgi:hypothetical protein